MSASCRRTQVSIGRFLNRSMMVRPGEAAGNGRSTAGSIEHLAGSVKMADPAADGTILANHWIPKGSFRNSPKGRPRNGR